MILDIEEGALWERRGADCILVDADQHVCVTYNANLFKPQKH